MKECNLVEVGWGDCEIRVTLVRGVLLLEGLIVRILEMQREYEGMLATRARFSRRRQGMQISAAAGVG